MFARRIRLKRPGVSYQGAIQAARIVLGAIANRDLPTLQDMLQYERDGYREVFEATTGVVLGDTPEDVAKALKTWDASFPPVTIDDALRQLNRMRLESQLGGDTVLHICLPEVEYMSVRQLKLEQDNDGAVVLVMAA